MNDITTFRTGNDSIVAEGTVVNVDERATLKDWKAFGSMLKTAETKMQWHLGAWWTYGHKKWGRGAEDVIKELGYSRRTLQTYGQVYQRVESTRRLVDLSYSHHQEVAYLPPKKQSHYLDLAKKENLSSGKLRQIIQQNERTQKTKTAKTKKHYLTSKRHTDLIERIEEIAKLLNVSVSAHVPVTLLKNKVSELIEIVKNFDTIK